jgi:dTMP kinase
LRSIREWTTKSLWPDKTILLDCDIDAAMIGLVARDGADRHRIEQEDRIFHREVRNGYLALAEKEPERFLVLDASKPPATVIEEFYERFRRVEVGR